MNPPDPAQTASAAEPAAGRRVSRRIANTARSATTVAASAPKTTPPATRKRQRRVKATNEPAPPEDDSYLLEIPDFNTVDTKALAGASEVTILTALLGPRNPATLKAIAREAADAAAIAVRKQVLAANSGEGNA